MDYGKVDTNYLCWNFELNNFIHKLLLANIANGNAT